MSSKKPLPLQAIEDLLTSISHRPPRTHCPQCRTPLLVTDAVFFFLDEGDKGWPITKTLCPNCEEGSQASSMLAPLQPWG